MTCDHDWVTIGENTGGFVLWCQKCGAVMNEDGTDYEEPTHEQDS
jgi:hypothetical protein